MKPVLKDHSIGHKYAVSQDRWSLVTDSIILKCRTRFYLECVVFQDRTLKGVAFHDRFYCTIFKEITTVKDKSENTK